MVDLKEGDRRVPQQLRPALSLFRKLKAESDVAKFRAETRSVIAGMVREGAITAPESEELIKLRDMVIGWRTTPGFTASAAFSEWLERYRATSDEAQRAVLRDLVICLPKGTLEEDLWWPIVTGEDEGIRHAIISAKIVRPADLSKLAKSRPGDFLRSRGLDALLEMEVVIPRVVWEVVDPVAVGADSPSALEEGLAISFSLDLAHDSGAWLIGFLSTRPELRRKVIEHLLREPTALLRLIRASAGYGVAADGLRAKRESTTVDSLLADVVTACAEAMAWKRPTAAIAERSLYLLRQLIASEPDNYSDEVKSTLDTAVRPTIALRLAEVLRRAQTSKDPARDPGLTLHVLPARGDEIAGAVELFLADLPTDAGGEHSHSHYRIERYLAVRELVEDVLPLLDAPPGTDLTGSLRTALFNAGASSIGVVDEKCAFDPVLHEPSATDPTVGDVVRIHDPGWQIGQGPSAIVLRKARVELDATPLARPSR